MQDLLVRELAGLVVSEALPTERRLSKAEKAKVYRQRHAARAAAWRAENIDSIRAKDRARARRRPSRATGAKRGAPRRYTDEERKQRARAAARAWRAAHRPVKSQTDAPGA
jgi:hypothetical protein